MGRWWRRVRRRSSRARALGAACARTCGDGWVTVREWTTVKRRARGMGKGGRITNNRVERAREWHQSLFSRELSSAALLASRTPDELGAAAEGACDCAFPADAVGAILCALTTA